MNSLERYGPIIVGGLAVIAFGIWNPRIFQQKKGDRYSGFPSYFWLAVISVIASLLFQAFNPLESLCKKI